MESARERVIGWLARRDYSRAELATKLQAEGYVVADIDDAITHAVRYAKLDDDTLAARVAQKKRDQGYGAARVSQELEKRGLMAAVDENGDLERAQRAWREVELKYKGRWAAAAGYLSRRGFSEEVVRRVLPPTGESE